MDFHVKNDSKTFFIYDVFDAGEYFSSYLYKNICVVDPPFLGGLDPFIPSMGLHPQTPNAVGLNLRPTGSCELSVNVSKSVLQNRL